MYIEHEGIKIELTPEQVRSIEQQKNKKSPEHLFKELVLDKIDIHNPKTDFERFENRIYWFDGNGNYVCHYNWETKVFWFNYSIIWSVFYKQFDWNYGQTQEFLKTQVEEHFKLKGVTTASVTFA